MAEDTTLSYCGQQAKAHDRDRFLAALFVPEPARESLFALSALRQELEHVHHAVKEEMIGHIRYAWWQEALDKLHAGEPPRGQPVLESLFVIHSAGRLPQAAFQPLLDAYRGAFPQRPTSLEAVMDEMSLTLLQAAQAQAGDWQKARRLIAHHRARWGGKGNGWLSLKLLAAGR